MTNSRSHRSFRQVTDSVDFPKFVSDFLNGLYASNLGIQHMDQTGMALINNGFAEVGHVLSPFQAGDVALFGARMAIYDGTAWVTAAAEPVRLWPPYRVYRYRHFSRR